MFDVTAKPYPYNLLYLVFNGSADVELPDDIEEAMGVVLTLLSERERTFIQLCFVEGKTLNEIAPLIGLSSGASVGDVQRRMILRIRHISRRKYLEKGHKSHE